MARYIQSTIRPRIKVDDESQRRGYRYTWGRTARTFIPCEIIGYRGKRVIIMDNRGQVRTVSGYSVEE